MKSMMLLAIKPKYKVYGIFSFLININTQITAPA
jgi:hypothetical protein